MGFFELPAWRPESEYRTPAWLGPPEDVLPGVVPVELLMARSEDRAVLFTSILAYPKGFAFTLSVRLRRVVHRQPPRGGEVDDPDEFGDRYLRFGVEFADGRTATSLGRRPRDVEVAEPDAPMLTGTGGEGGGRVWDSHQWVWGLPPPGPLVFVCAWSAHQRKASRVEVDAGLVLEAAERAVPV